MSLQKPDALKQARKNLKPVPDAKFVDISEKLIERDFFPTLYDKRLEAVVDLTQEDDHASSMPPSSLSLDRFNEKHVSKSTVELQESLSTMKSNRHERMYGIRDPEKLNNFMFNHPGIAQPATHARPRINYSNTRFPIDSPQRARKRKGSDS